jgi:hypothetical protein
MIEECANNADIPYNENPSKKIWILFMMYLTFCPKLCAGRDMRYERGTKAKSETKTDV